MASSEAQRRWQVSPHVGTGNHKYEQQRKPLHPQCGRALKWISLNILQSFQYRDKSSPYLFR